MGDLEIKDLELEALRSQTIAQIEKTERIRKWTLKSIAVLEVLVIGLFAWLADFSDRTHLLLFIAVLGIWGIIGLALIVLGILQKENTLRILNAIQSIKKSNKL
jgi:hypothetical protein